MAVLEFDIEEKFVTFDRTDYGHDMRSEKQRETGERDIRKSRCYFTDTLNLRIFVDVSTVEIFVNGGEKVISSRFYSEDKDYNIKFGSDGKTTIKEIKKYDIVV